MSKVETFEVESFQWNSITEIQELLDLDSEVSAPEEHLSAQARERWLGEAISTHLDQLREELGQAEIALDASEEARRALGRLERARGLERAASEQGLFEEVLRGPGDDATSIVVGVLEVPGKDHHAGPEGIGLANEGKVISVRSDEHQDIEGFADGLFIGFER